LTHWNWNSTVVLRMLLPHRVFGHSAWYTENLFLHTMCTLNGFVTTHCHSNFWWVKVYWVNFWYDSLQTQKCSTIFEESSNCLAEPLRSWHLDDVYGPENQQTGKCSLKHVGKTPDAASKYAFWYVFSFQ
jgi:hypothetical protein